MACARPAWRNTSRRWSRCVEPRRQTPGAPGDARGSPQVVAPRDVPGPPTVTDAGPAGSLLLSEDDLCKIPPVPDSPSGAGMRTGGRSPQQRLAALRCCAEAITTGFDHWSPRDPWSLEPFPAGRSADCQLPGGALQFPWNAAARLPQNADPDHVVSTCLADRYSCCLGGSPVPGHFRSLGFACWSDGCRSHAYCDLRNNDA